MKILLGAILLLAFVVVVAIILALPVMLIVNYLFTQSVLIYLFGIPALTFWKALWLNILCGFIFKSGSNAINN
jgi:hypothetical protein